MKKCDKYQTYFLFKTEEELLEHIKECPDCAEEHAKMQNVDNLVREVKTIYKNKKKNYLLAKVACFSALMMFTLTVPMLNNFYVLSEYEYIEYIENSIVDEMGFPVDGYGLIRVD